MSKDVQKGQKTFSSILRDILPTNYPENMSLNQLAYGGLQSIKLPQNHENRPKLDAETKRVKIEYFVKMAYK